MSYNIVSVIGLPTKMIRSPITARETLNIISTPYSIHILHGYTFPFLPQNKVKAQKRLAEKGNSSMKYCSMCMMYTN